MENCCRSLILPKLTKKSSTKNQLQRLTKRSTSRSSVQVLLKQIRSQQNQLNETNENKMLQGMKKMSKIQRKYERISKLQIRRYDERERMSLANNNDDEEIIEEQNLCAMLYKYDTMIKPPHRYRTALTLYDQELFLFGGFGYQKFLGLTKYSIKKQEWEAPKVEDTQEIAVYGHTMTTYKGNSYVFGGIRMDNPSSELLQIDLKTSNSTKLPSAPHRRRDHAATFLTRFMIVHGGVQIAEQIKNTFFYFDTESSKWYVPQQYQMPYLSHHALVVVPQKNRKKQYSIFEVFGQNVYIFGGKTQRQTISNKLYRIKVRESNDLTTQQIQTKGTPFPRYSACVQFIDPCYICVYGGKSDTELTNNHMQQGIFNDLNLLHIEKKEWVTPSINIKLPFRFGAASTVSKNKLFIFGGSEVNNYSDGSLLQLVIAKEGEEEDMQEIIRRRGRLRS